MKYNTKMGFVLFLITMHVTTALTIKGTEPSIGIALLIIILTTLSFLLLFDEDIDWKKLRIRSDVPA